MMKRQLFPTIAQAFLDKARTRADRRAFHYKDGTGWVSVTWREYYESVKLISLGLSDLGIRPGENVCLLSNTRLEWAAADMAILGTRAVTVPIYASLTADESAYIASHCDARFIFVEDNKQLEKILSVRASLPKLEKIIVFSLAATQAVADEKDVFSLTALRDRGRHAKSPERFEQNLMALSPNDVFTICYTSGTTGAPKGVVLTLDNLNSVIEDVDKVFGEQVGEHDITLSFLPLSHVFGRVESMAAYHFGWQTYYAENVEKLSLNMVEIRPTLLFGVPRVFEKAYNRIKASLDESSALKKGLFERALKAGRRYHVKVWSHRRPSLVEKLEYEAARRTVFKTIYDRFGGRMKFCIAGGAPLPQEIGEFMGVVGITVLEGYGLTETCAPIAVNTPQDLKHGSIGKPLPEVSIKIADDGEILLKSRKVFREYYKNPEATREALDDEGWFHTGDIGVIDDEGFVKITDRKKDLIITSGGKNIAPQKIENLAKTNKFISQFVVHGDGKHYLTALVSLEEEEIVKFAKENNILFSEYAELVKNHKIQALIQGLMDQLNEQLASFERIKKFKILPHGFSIETGELTPSLKIKRRYITQKYKADLESLYGN